MNGKICLCFKKTLSLLCRQAEDLEGIEGGGQGDLKIMMVKVVKVRMKLMLMVVKVVMELMLMVVEVLMVVVMELMLNGDFDLLRGLVQVGGDHLDGDRQGARLVSLQEERLR